MNRAEKRRQKKLAKKAASNAKLGKATIPSPGQQTPTIQQSLELAVRHHNAGDLAKAEGIYQQVLQADPRQPAALHLLGVIAHQGEENDIAVDLITQALAIKPDLAEAHSNLGIALRDLGRLDEAVASYQKALSLKPDYAKAHNNLGNALQDMGRLDEALESFRKALSFTPENKLSQFKSGKIRAQIWKVEKSLGLFPLYASLDGQDKYIHETFFKGREEGVFVEIGGFNGWDGSNCLFFEKSLNWTGIIVEASPSLVEKISQNRRGKGVHAAVTDHDGKANFIEITSGLTMMSGLAEVYEPEILKATRKHPNHIERNIVVPAITLDSLLRKYKMFCVDYCSIDVEGAEKSILKQFRFDDFDISVFSIENNSGNRDKSVQVILRVCGM
jgi:FkbM family methyltransferase